jgi:hypothetical protein
VQIRNDKIDKIEREGLPFGVVRRVSHNTRVEASSNAVEAGDGDPVLVCVDEVVIQEDSPLSLE